jgi:hypothetical protein
MTAKPRNFSASPPSPQIVPYLDLGGGLNTGEDPHAIARNELSTLINCWYMYGRSLSKRPGSVPFLSSGVATTGGGGVGQGCATCVFNNVTYVIAQVNGNKLYAATISDPIWTLIGTMGAGAGPVHAAQFFEPKTQTNCVFIVNGVDTPWVWQGPGHTITPASGLAGSALPLKLGGGAGNYITPAFVCSFQNFLFYSGEPTVPCGVYVSDVTTPNSFTRSATFDPTGTTYVPYYVGNNDGVSGGSITGIINMEQGVVVFKQSAIYFMSFVSIYGDTIFDPILMSASLGCTAPQSITTFDSFVCFLAIDGVYTFAPGAGQGAATKLISRSTPHYFDSTYTGYPALVANRVSPIGVRSGNKYLLFFSTGITSYVNDTGLWFNFDITDKNSLPTIGEINGMCVAGASALRGAGDDGNFVWVDSSIDRVSKFGVGFSDPVVGQPPYGAPIQCIFIGKSDFLDDVFEDGLLRAKKLSKIGLVLSLYGKLSSSQYVGTLEFTSYWFGSNTSGSQQVGSTESLAINIGGSSVWGLPWGEMTWGSNQTYSQPYAIFMSGDQAPCISNAMQIGFSESSTLGWTVIGYTAEFSLREPIRASIQSL